MNSDINGDAVYAAFVFLRDYAESEQGQAEFRELMDVKAQKVESLRRLASEISRAAAAGFRPIPRFGFSPGLYEDIYSGEPESVELGLEVARFLIWGSDDYRAHMAKSARGPVGEAIRRFIADRAN